VEATLLLSDSCRHFSVLRNTLGRRSWTNSPQKREGVKAWQPYGVPCVHVSVCKATQEILREFFYRLREQVLSLRWVRAAVNAALVKAVPRGCTPSLATLCMPACGPAGKEQPVASNNLTAPANNVACKLARCRHVRWTCCGY
jgi:hypothetical protein